MFSEFDLAHFTDDVLSRIDTGSLIEVFNKSCTFTHDNVAPLKLRMTKCVS